MKKGLIGAVYNCQECNEEWSWYKTARNHARKHNRETGHAVSGEETVAVDFKKEKP